jgi:hypothetical protein
MGKSRTFFEGGRGLGRCWRYIFIGGSERARAGREIMLMLLERTGMGFDLAGEESENGSIEQWTGTGASACEVIGDEGWRSPGFRDSCDLLLVVFSLRWCFLPLDWGEGVARSTTISVIGVVATACARTTAGVSMRAGTGVIVVGAVSICLVELFVRALVSRRRAEEVDEITEAGFERDNSPRTGVGLTSTTTTGGAEVCRRWLGRW